MRCAAALAAILSLPVLSAQAQSAPANYGKWKNGPPTDTSFFPIAVWLQNPSNAGAYKALGVNTFVGLWQGPTQDQLSALASQGMYVVCQQDRGAFGSRSVIGWLQQDEPDNAQAQPGQGYGPPVPPSELQSRYRQMTADDPTRPVLLNLGVGATWDGWYGRGVRTNHPEDYPEYVKAADIVSFDIYPANSRDADVSGRIWLVAQGVDRVRQWVGGGKPVWTWIECTHIYAGWGRRPSPREVRAEVWMALIHGSSGIGYFAHTMEPFSETGLLRDEEMKTAVATIDAEVTALAPVLNSPGVASILSRSDKPSVPVDAASRRLGGDVYVFAVAMRPGAATATFTLAGMMGSSQADVIGENRRVAVEGGVFRDTFSDYAVHLYRIRG